MCHLHLAIVNVLQDLLGLVEMPMGGRYFTWMNKVGTKLSKLDRFLISDKEERIRLLHKLNDILHFESMDLRQKARLKWDVEGDENSKFFHSLIKQRRRCQAIQGVMVNAVDSTTNIELEKPITSEEIRRAVWDCGSDKSPGPNGFLFHFLKTLWVMLKADMELFVMSFFTSSKMPVGANSSFITLLPKILANRLASVVKNIVSHEQSAFIAGRQILDGPLILSEVIDWYRQCNKKMMIFKVDFEKAYDSVNWKYLDYILEQFGFGLKWGGWIQECLQSACTSILVNGSPTSEFSIKRCLRQGYQLSPNLFILIMEGLHIAIKDAVQASLIRGVK
ncbi:RNA-directed DNA polymerase, eukaryota, reverse transcriptase zinc-binding domain protein, partial [Tanacetum coccineum]